MRSGRGSGSLSWVHIGDLHISTAQSPNYADFLAIIGSINTQLAEQIDFCILPGDNADDGSSAQYALIREGLDGLKIPVHILPGDHDRKAGHLRDFYHVLEAPRLPFALSACGYRCIFLDMVSAGRGGADFALGEAQLRWLEAELGLAASHEDGSVIFMHAYPADLKAERERVCHLLARHKVAVVDMGHTHYNELANDGRTIFATTRSTGQIEEGPVGFSLVCLHRGVVSWRFKTLESAWPLVMITSPGDHRLITDVKNPNQIVSGWLPISARVFGSSSISGCRCRIDEGRWTSMHLELESRQWVGMGEAPSQQFVLTVEATDTLGQTDSDTIEVAVPGYLAPPRRADGSDADAVGAWPSRHLLGSRLGPNRNGRQW